MIKYCMHLSLHIHVCNHESHNYMYVHMYVKITVHVSLMKHGNTIVPRLPNEAVNAQ